MKCLFNFLLFLFFLLVTCASNAQNADNVRDSLIKIIPALKDTAKLDALFELMGLTEDRYLFRKYMGEFVEEAERLGKKRDVALGKANIAWVNYDVLDDEAFVESAKDAENYAFKHKYYLEFFYTRQLFVDYYLDKGMYADALNLAEEAYSLARELEQPNNIIAQSINSLASAYTTLGRIDESVKLYKESLRLHDADDNDFTRLEAFRNLINEFLNMRAYAEACCYTDTLVSLKDIWEPPFIRTQTDFLCETFYAKCYTGLNEPKRAMRHLETAESMLTADFSALDSLFYYDSCVEYYIAEKNFQQAAEYCDKCLSIGIAKSSTGIDVLKYYLHKAYILSASGKSEEACELYEHYIVVSDSISSVKFTEQLNHIRVVYELDKVEMEVERQRLSLEAHRNMIAGLGGTCIFLLIIGVLIYVYSKRLEARNKLLYRQICENDELEQEIEEKNVYISQISGNSEQIRNGRLFVALKELMKDESVYTQPDIDRKKVSDMLNTNEKYLFDTIKENTGLSFSEYISGLRLNLAKKLLAEDNNLTIEDIALRSGFGSRTTFYRLFRENYKLTPAEFRKAALNKTD